MFDLICLANLLNLQFLKKHETINEEMQVHFCLHKQSPINTLINIKKKDLSLFKDTLEQIIYVAFLVISTVRSETFHILVDN